MVNIFELSFMQELFTQQEKIKGIKMQILLDISHSVTYGQHLCLLQLDHNEQTSSSTVHTVIFPNTVGNSEHYPEFCVFIWTPELGISLPTYRYGYLYMRSLTS